MNCRRVEQVLSDHLEGLLSPRESGAVAAHLQDCPACRRLREEYRSLHARMRDLAEQLPVPGPEIERRSIERWLGDREPARGAWRCQFLIPAAAPLMRGKYVRAAAVATLGLAILGVTLVRWHHGGEPGQPPLSSVQRLHDGRPAPGPILVPRPPLLPSDQQIVGSRRRAPDRASPRTLSARPSLAGAAEDPARGKPSLPSGQRGRRPGADDLDALNGTPSAPTRPWQAHSRDDWGQIETRVRGAVPVRDDFVYIPFPRLAATADVQIAAAVESYEREAAIVDARLAREVTLGIKATALADACERLRADTGIRLEAGASLADEKVTLFCRKRPLREVMRQLSRPFGYAWLRGGKTGEYKYELVQDLRSQLLEEELRNRARGEALLALDREMQRYRPYLALSPDEALARSKTALPQEKKLLENLAGKGWGPIQMYFRLSPDDVAVLRAGQRLDFPHEPRPGQQPLPPEVARGVLQSRREVRLRDDPAGGDRAQFGNAENLSDGLPPVSFPRARARVWLHLGHTELGQYTMDGVCAVEVGTQTTMTRGELASGMSPAVRNPENARFNARWSQEPALRARVSLSPQPSCRPAPGAGPAPPPGSDVRVTSADVLEALHRASGLPIVADYYTRLHPADQVSLRNLPIFDALNRLSDTMRLHWSREKEGSWLQFRSVGYYDDRLKEVPDRLLNRWAASRRQQGHLTLDDLCEIARLPDVQLNSGTMAKGARECFDLWEWDLAHSEAFRPHLRYLAGLTPDQRRRVVSAAGLPFAQLSLSQQQQLAAHLGERLPSLDALSHMTVRVEYIQPGEFQWVRPGMSEFQGGDRPWPANFFKIPTVRDRTREAVLQAARRIDPNLDPAQIRPTELWLAVIYRRVDSQTGKLMEEWGHSGTAQGGRVNW